MVGAWIYFKWAASKPKPEPKDRPYSDQQREQIAKAVVDPKVRLTEVKEKAPVSTSLIHQWTAYITDYMLNSWGAVEVERRVTNDPAAVPRSIGLQASAPRGLASISAIVSAHCDIERVLPSLEARMPGITELLRFRHEKLPEISHVMIVFEDGSMQLLTGDQFIKNPPQKQWIEVLPVERRRILPWEAFWSGQRIAKFAALSAIGANGELGLTSTDIIDYAYRLACARISKALELEALAKTYAEDGRTPPRMIDRNAADRLLKQKIVKKGATIR
jgi:transposase-like protein